MNTLKQVIHYPDTNSVEVTWVDSEGVVIKCHSYADVQMQMFRDDVAQFGGDIAEQEELISLVEANIKPVEPEPEKSYAELRAAEYPPIEDYIDGIVKGDTAQVQAYIDACLAVKAKYPKPLIEESTDEISS